MKRIAKFAFTITIVLFLLPFVYCYDYVNPILKNHYGVPVSYYGGMGKVIIYGEDYPEEQKMIIYNFTLDNDFFTPDNSRHNNIGIELTLTPSSSLWNYVSTAL